MPLQNLSFTLPETRFFEAGNFVYKFKIRGAASCREEVMGDDCLNLELEEIVRTVLGNLHSLKPFYTAHYIVFPYKKRWRGVCQHVEKKLRVYPFLLILYLVKNMQNGKQTEQKKEVMQHIPSVPEPQSKRHKTDSPLEDAILKDLINYMEDRSMVSMTRRKEHLHAEGEVKEDPGHTVKNGGADKPVLKSGVSVTGGSGSPIEVHPGKIQDMGEEEGTPVRPGILMRLASYFFPSFFKDPKMGESYWSQ